LEDEFAGLPLGVAALGRDPRARALHDRMCAVARTKTAEEWEHVLAAEGTTGVMCRTTGDWLRSAHALQAGLAVKVGGRGSDTVQPGPVLRVAGERPRIKPARTVARPRWLSPALSVPSATPTPPGAPLAGVRVVDFTVILA